MKKLQQNYVFFLLLTLCLPLGISSRNEVEAKAFWYAQYHARIKQHKKEIGVGTVFLAIIGIIYFNWPTASQIEKEHYLNLGKTLGKLIDKRLTKDTVDNSEIITAIKKIQQVKYKDKDYKKPQKIIIKWENSEPKTLKDHVDVICKAINFDLNDDETPFSYKGYIETLKSITKIRYTDGDSNKLKTVKIDEPIILANNTFDKLVKEKKTDEKKVYSAAVKMLAKLINNKITKKTEDDNEEIKTALKKIKSVTYQVFTSYEITVEISWQEEKLNSIESPINIISEALAPQITTAEEGPTYKDYVVPLMTITKITYTDGDSNAPKTVEVDWEEIEKFL